MIERETERQTDRHRKGEGWSPVLNLTELDNFHWTDETSSLLGPSEGEGIYEEVRE